MARATTILPLPSFVGETWIEAYLQWAQTILCPIQTIIYVPLYNIMTGGGSWEPENLSSVVLQRTPFFVFFEEDFRSLHNNRSSLKADVVRCNTNVKRRKKLVTIINSFPQTRVYFRIIDFIPWDFQPSYCLFGFLCSTQYVFFRPEGIAKSDATLIFFIVTCYRTYNRKNAHGTE